MNRVLDETREKEAIRHSDWRRRNIDSIREKQRRWQRDNHDKLREAHHKRLQLMREAQGSYSQEQIADLYKFQKERCWYCFEPLNGIYDIDHYVPLSRGGSNDISNIVLACAPCNRSKGDKLPSEFIGRL
jgi:CRISPR/Cas system Type II protein with McrA/HNH and RuvC-like nuclease domain